MEAGLASGGVATEHAYQATRAGAVQPGATREVHIGIADQFGELLSNETLKRGGDPEGTRT